MANYDHVMRMYRDTSREAWASIQPAVPKIVARILPYVQTVEGATSDEIEVQEGMRHQTVSSRLCALNQSGLIVDTGRRRVTRSGRKAIVWQWFATWIECLERQHVER